MTYFKAPVNRGIAAGFETWFVYLTTSFDRKDWLLGDACSGFLLYEFYEAGQLVRVLSSTLDAPGRCQSRQKISHA